MPALVKFGATVLVAALSWSFPAAAMKVTQVKGSQALVTLEAGDSANEGDQYFVMINGKKLGLLQITKVKGARAIGNLKKGRAEVGSELSLARAGGAAAASSAGGGDDFGGGAGDGGGKVKKRAAKKSSASSLTAGILLGYNMASQSVKDANSSNTIQMSGSGLSLKAFGDMPLGGSLGVIARAGGEQVKLTGNQGGKAFNTSILYLTVDGLLRYQFMSGDFVPYGAIGIGLHLPMSKESNALQDIPMTTVGFIDLGFNYNMSASMYLTVFGEYGIFPPSNEVTTTFYVARFGAGFRF